MCFNVISVPCKRLHRKMLNFKSQSPLMVVLSIYSGKIQVKTIRASLCLLCTTVLYEYINSLGNDVCNLFVNTHERIKIYREFYHCIIYIANEGRHVRIKDNFLLISLWYMMFLYFRVVIRELRVYLQFWVLLQMENKVQHQLLVFLHYSWTMRGRSKLQGGFFCPPFWST